MIIEVTMSKVLLFSAVGITSDLSIWKHGSDQTGH